MKLSICVRIACIVFMAVLFSGDVLRTPGFIASAQSASDYEQQALYALGVGNKLQDDYMKKGYVFQPGVQTRGNLPTGFYSDFALHVQDVPSGGVSHVFLAACDTRCLDLRLAFYDPEGNLIVQNRRSSKMPVIEFKTLRPGNYRLRIIMVHCLESNCFWRAHLLSK